MSAGRCETSRHQISTEDYARSDDCEGVGVMEEDGMLFSFETCKRECTWSGGEFSHIIYWISRSKQLHCNLNDQGWSWFLTILLSEIILKNKN